MDCRWYLNNQIKKDKDIINTLNKQLKDKGYDPSKGLTDEQYTYFLSAAQDELLKLQSLKEGVKKTSRFYSAGLSNAEKQKAANELVNKINQASKLTKEGNPIFLEDGEAEYVYDDGQSVGVTSLISTIGYRDKWDDPIVTAFDLVQWRARRIKKLMEERKLSEPQAIQTAENEIKQWTILNEIGNELHEIYQLVLSGKKDFPEYKHISEQQFNKIKKEAEEYKRELYRRYPGCKIWTEVGMSTKPYSENGDSGLSKDFHDIMQKHKWNRISGRADILIIDNQGEAHIIDLKVSRKSIGKSYKSDKGNNVIEEWNVEDNNLLTPFGFWDSTKKLMAKNQLAFYAGILEQYGLKVSTAGIAPIKLELDYNDDGDIVGVSDVFLNKKEEIQNVPGTVNGRYHDHVRDLLGWELKLDNDVLSEVNEQMRKLFPDINMDDKSKRRVRTVDSYLSDRFFVHNVKPGSKMYEEGYMYYFKRREVGKAETVYCKDQDELRARIEEYIEELTKVRARELGTVCESLRNAVSNTHDISSFQDLFFESRQKWLETMFDRYIHGGWTVVNNQDLFNNGIVIFKQDNRVEILVITNENIQSINKIGFGTTILGRKYTDDKVDTKDFMYASNGNLAILKAMAYIANNKETFEGTVVTNVGAVNPWYSQATNEPLDRTVRNYNELKDTYKGILPDLPNIFLNSSDAFVLQAHDLVENISFEHFDPINVLPNGNVAQYTLEQIENMIDRLKIEKKLGDNWDKANFESRDWRAFALLQQAKLWTLGFSPIHEGEVGSWLVKRGLGLNITSINDSASTNARIVGDIVNEYKGVIQEAYWKETTPWLTMIDKFYKHRKPGVKLTGGEVDVYKNWIRKGDDGEIDPSFTFVDPDDLSDPIEKEALDKTLKLLAKHRFGDDERKIAEAKANGAYYEIPLCKASTNRQIKQLGVREALKNWFNEQKNLSDYALHDDRDDARAMHEDHMMLYNRFDLTGKARQDRIDRLGVGYFEQNIEVCVLEAMLGYLRSEIGNEYLAKMEAVRLILKYQDNVEGYDNENVRTFLKKYVTKKIYGDPIMDKSLRGTYAVFNQLKQFVSANALAFNLRAMSRETLQGVWVNLSRAGVEQLEGVTMKTWMAGFTEVILKGSKDINILGKLEQLNHIFGMANYSISDMARKRRLNRVGLRNASTETMFLTSTLPDFMHRMAILIAKMKGDGCWDAIQMDSEGMVTYDMTKDKRYSVYLSGDKTNEQYWYQKALYESNLEQFKKEGATITENEMLPWPYTKKEIARIRGYGDRLFGHYDTETKSLMTDMFLGAMCMQYRTFVTAKFEQWFARPGVYNGSKHVIRKDPETGEEIWKVVNYPDPEKCTGVPDIQYIPKSQVTQDMIRKGIAQPDMQWEGWQMEGIWWTMMSFGKALLTMDQETLNYIWHDPIKKANLVLFFSDMILMSLIAFLINLMFMGFTGTEDKDEMTSELRKRGGLLAWSYGVLNGSTQDGPVNQIIASLFNTFDPPAYTALQTLYKTTKGMVLGDISGLEWLERNFGATRELFTYIDYARSL